ncbi:MAG: c-type cytochrome [Betaproteobacteria bacterium]
MIRRAVIFSVAFLLSAGPLPGNANGDAVRGAQKVAACAVCHGAPERPPLPGMPTLAGQQPEFLVLQMFFMREGLRVVPPMAGLLKDFTDRDLEDVAAYFSAQKPSPESSKRDQQIYARGAALSRGMGCGSCHLADYRGQRHIPRITGQREDYLALTLRAYRDDKRTGADTSMNAAMYRATDSDIRDLAHYLAQQ